MDKPSQCSSCVLNFISYQFLSPQGKGNNKVLIFTDFPERRDIISNEYLHPATMGGEIFTTALRRTQLDKSDFGISGLVSCQPPSSLLQGAGYESAALGQCSVHRDKAIKQLQPNVLLGLGNIALKTLTGHEGKKAGIDTMRGYVIPSKEYVFWRGMVININKVPIEHIDKTIPVPVIPTYDPKFIRAGRTKFIMVYMFDILRAVQLAKSIQVNLTPHPWYKEDAPPSPYEWFKPESLDYKTITSVEELTAFRKQLESNPTQLLTYDIETKTSANELEDEIDTNTTGDIIESIQFSLAVGSGVFVPWESAFLPEIRKILASPNPKAGFNLYLFDDRVLLSSGQDIVINGIRHDLLWAWKHLQRDLTANLQYVAGFYGFPFPWKHLSGSNPSLYGCCDVDAPQRIAGQIFNQMDAKGIRIGYDRHIVELQRALNRVEIRGVPMNGPKLKGYGEELSKLAQEIFAEIQVLYPTELQGIKIYKTWPKGIRKHLVDQGLTPKNVVVTEELVKEFNDNPETKDPVLDDKGRTGEWVFVDGNLGIRKPFLPNSSDHILAYLRHMAKKDKRYKVPTKFKTGDDTTEKKELQRIIDKTGDMVLKKALEYREYGKMKSTYVDGWMPKEFRS